MTFSQSPRHGHIGLPLGTPADMRRSYSLVEMKQLQYCHDDSETKSDTFDVKGHDSAGHVTDDLTIRININPVNDHQVKFRDGLQVGFVILINCF